jgi:hypothetical protein
MIAMQGLNGSYPGAERRRDAARQDPLYCLR